MMPYFHESTLMHLALFMLFLQADKMIKEETQYLRVSMGHENESLDEFVEAHNTCLNDLMYFPTRNAYGLSSVAVNVEKLPAFQSEFEIVKKKMDDDKEKALHLEKKVKLLTQGYEVCLLIISLCCYILQCC